MKKLETIVVPSGNFKEDAERFDKAMEYGATLKNQSKKVKYILSGVGPDLNRRLSQEKGMGKYFFTLFEGTNGLDVHPELWNRAVKKAGANYRLMEIVNSFGVDVLSLNSVENMVNTFPPGIEGDYTIVSRKFHNARFRLIEKRGRAEGYFGKNLKISYVNTNHKYSVVDVVEDIVHLVKEIFFGEKKVKKTIAKLKD